MRCSGMERRPIWLDGGEGEGGTGRLVLGVVERIVKILKSKRA